MHGKLGTTVASVVVAMVVAACGSSVKLEEKAPVETRAPGDGSAGANPGGPGTGSGTGQSAVATVDLNRAD